MTPQHIFMVDDDPEIRHMVGAYLEKNGFRVSLAQDGRGFLEMIRRNKLDLVILDLTLPGDDGLNLCRSLRAVSNLPVIILSARGDEADRVMGLELGADDYLPKPFSMRELLARVRSVLRRSRSLDESGADRGHEAVLRFGTWMFEVASKRLHSAKGQIVTLSGGEVNMLLAFLNHPNRVLTRDELLDLTRGRDSDIFDRSIDMQISRLRKQLGDDPRKPEYIKTVRNTGYIFCANVKIT